MDEPQEDWKARYEQAQGELERISRILGISDIRSDSVGLCIGRTSDGRSAYLTDEIRALTYEARHHKSLLEALRVLKRTMDHEC